MNVTRLLAQGRKFYTPGDVTCKRGVKLLPSAVWSTAALLCVSLTLRLSLRALCIAVTLGNKGFNDSLGHTYESRTLAVWGADKLVSPDTSCTSYRVVKSSVGGVAISLFVSSTCIFSLRILVKDTESTGPIVRNMHCHCMWWSECCHGHHYLPSVCVCVCVCL